MNAYLIMLTLCILLLKTSIREKEDIFLMLGMGFFFHTFETPNPAALPHPQSRSLKGSITWCYCPYAFTSSIPQGSGGQRSVLLAAQCWEHPDMALGSCCPLARSNIQPLALPVLSAPCRDPPYHASGVKSDTPGEESSFWLWGLFLKFFLVNFMDPSQQKPLF